MQLFAVEKKVVKNMAVKIRRIDDENVDQNISSYMGMDDFNVYARISRYIVLLTYQNCTVAFIFGKRVYNGY